MTDLHRLTATEIAAGIRERRFTAVEVAGDTLAHVERLNPVLNCFTDILAESAMESAAEVDARLADGQAPGLLAGVPFGVKNLFDIAGLPTLAGSKINRDLPPATADGVLVARMKSAGAVLLGGQHMDEYAYGFTTENAHYGPARNPRDMAHVAGGSSGGSAAAVAAGLGPVSLGSDTNGSIRVPSSFCGIFGLKPTFGRLPRTGSFPFVHDLDHLGPFARSVADLALCYDALQGWDAGDPACANRPIEQTLMRLEQPIDGLRVAVLDGWFRDTAGPEALTAVGLVADALKAERSITLDNAAEARAAAFCITAAEGANLHFENLKTRADDFDPAVRDRLLAGALLPSTVLVQAHRLRRWFRDQVARVFRDVDVVLAPATPCPAPLIGQPTIRLGGQDVPTRPNIGVYTQPISFIGLPVVAVPVPSSTALPVGVQIIAAPWQESLALRVAAHLERCGVVAAPLAEV
ncbi:AtzE family amidohydrolase [Iodidimonas sp. SYSU 1G8]|uniref:AtzE family amidohydrolase n=1 Tax=Iodidimonas sp. SYSU 1G8 TaxID=3133967 RepID=UPI0031FE6FBD